jgi:hypothetical protein
MDCGRRGRGMSISLIIVEADKEIHTCDIQSG